mmetsp:Transcript_45708/g.143460  ORF Transcript_45708/g.143460 Transcript_45708/m.143460 type:complete len:223 (+) Transcript_45708:852-1520(+)
MLSSLRCDVDLLAIPLEANNHIPSLPQHVHYFHPNATVDFGIPVALKKGNLSYTRRNNRYDPCHPYFQKKRTLLQSLKIVNATNDCRSLQRIDLCWSNTTVVWEISSALQHYTRIQAGVKEAIGSNLRNNMSSFSSLRDCPYEEFKNRRLFNHGYELMMKLHVDLLFTRPSTASIYLSFGTSLAAYGLSDLARRCFLACVRLQPSNACCRHNYRLLTLSSIE